MNLTTGLKVPSIADTAIRRSAERLGTTFLDAGEPIRVGPVEGLDDDAETRATLGRVNATQVQQPAAAAS